MARRPKHFGKCHICGIEGKLTFEHVPPRAAFNDKPVLIGKFEDMINRGFEPITTGKIEQRGLGGYTLCAKCNNNTGALYGKYFVDWCYQALILYRQLSSSSILYYIIHLIFTH